KFQSVKVPEQGVFFRTFYGTRKIHPGLNLAPELDDLISGATALVVALRDTKAIGGIAGRGLLQNAEPRGARGRNSFFRELRVFLVWGEPVFWALKGDHSRSRKLPEGFLASLARLDATDHAQLLELSRRVGKTLRAKFVVADFAVLKDGSLSLVETNEGHCSGWPSELAFAAVHAQVLRRAAGLPLLDRSGVLGVAKKTNLETFGLDEFLFVVEEQR